LNNQDGTQYPTTLMHFNHRLNILHRYSSGCTAWFGTLIWGVYIQIK
jgi:hypothetical protein